MVLDKHMIDEMMDEQVQKEEIQRIIEAPEGLVLYTSYVADKESANIYETLLEMAGCAYHESLWLSRGIIKWVKGHCKYNFVA